MIPLIVIPFLNRRDLLNRCIQSIDFPVQELLVMNNGARESLHEMMLPPSVVSYSENVSTSNYGVAGSWNFGLNHAFNACGYDYVIFCGNDIQWSSGDLQKMHEAYSPEADFISGNWAFSTFAITRRGFEKLGWFDEGIFPAYGEDVDFWRRCSLTPDFSCVSVDTQAIHGEAPHWGSSTIHSDPNLLQENHRTHDANLSYLERKWGWDRRLPMASAKFQTPFNSGRPIREWELSEERKLKPHFRSNG